MHILLASSHAQHRWTGRPKLPRLTAAASQHATNRHPESPPAKPRSYGSIVERRVDDAPAAPEQPIVPFRDESGRVVVKVARTTSAPGVAGCMCRSLEEQPHLQLLYSGQHPMYVAAKSLALVNSMQSEQKNSVFFVPTVLKDAVVEGARLRSQRMHAYSADVYAEPLMDEVMDGDVQRVQDQANDWRGARKDRGVRDERAHSIADVLYDAMEGEGDAVVVADTHGEVTTTMHAMALCNRRIAVEGRPHMLGCTVMFESNLRKGARAGRMLFYTEKRVMPAAEGGRRD